MTRREREELVEMLLHRAWWCDANRLPKHRLPGQAIASLPAATRERLAELTAADFQHRVL